MIVKTIIYVDKMFIIGGYYFHDNYSVANVTNACSVLVTNNYKWKKVAGMEET